MDGELENLEQLNMSEIEMKKNVGSSSGNSVNSQKVGQEQIHGLLFSEKLSWQAIIYDLINTEQLDPWDIDICLLANKYLDRIKELEEENFFVSSKVLLAASLLLRIKSEILLNKYLPSLDEILFGKEEKKEYVQERLELDDEIPELIPRTPLPRTKRVTLQELMAALGKAIKTETRRIKRVVIDRQREHDLGGFIPKKNINLREQVRNLYNKLKTIFSSNGYERTAFSEVAGQSAEEKISHFLPLLHLDSQHKVIAEQEEPFNEIWIWLKEVYIKKHFNILEQMRKEAEEAMKKDLIEMAKEGELEKLNKKKKFEKKKFKSVVKKRNELKDNDIERKEEF